MRPWADALGQGAQALTTSFLRHGIGGVGEGILRIVRLGGGGFFALGHRVCLLDNVTLLRLATDGNLPPRMMNEGENVGLVSLITRSCGVRGNS